MPDYTQSVTAAVEARILKAFGRYWDLRNDGDRPRDATHDEVNVFMQRQLAGVVRSYERRVEEDKVSVSDISVS